MEGIEQGGSTRRRLLLAAVAGPVIGGNVAWTAASLADKEDVDGDEDWISARIQAIELPDRAWIMPVGSARVQQVHITDATDVNRDGPAGLADFSVGETVAVRLGDDPGEGVPALKFHAFYHRLDDVEVLARDGAQLRTKDGRLELGKQAEVPERYDARGQRVPAKRLSEIRAGDRISVLGRHEPGRDAFVAHYVRAEQQ
jgi:hypothetical protein